MFGKVVQVGLFVIATGAVTSLIAIPNLGPRARRMLMGIAALGGVLIAVDIAVSLPKSIDSVESAARKLYTIVDRENKRWLNDPKRTLKTGWDRFYSKKFSDAWNAFTYVLETDTDIENKIDAHFGRGLIHFSQARLDDATTEFTRAIQIGPRTVLYSARGSAYDTLHRYHEAIFDYSAGLDLNPADDNIRERRGVAYARVGNREKALEDLRAVYRSDYGKRSSTTISWLRQLGDYVP